MIAKRMNKLLLLSIAGIGFYLVKRGGDLTALVDNISTRVSGIRIHQLDFSGLTIAANVEVNNPTRSTANISKPVVYLFSNGKAIGESNAVDSTIAIKPQAVTQLGSYLVTIPFISLLSIVGSINYGKLVMAFGQSAQAGVGAMLAQLAIPAEISVALYADGLFIKTPPVKIS